MAKVSRVRRLKYRSRDGKAERVRIPSCSHKIFKDVKKPAKMSEKKDWEDANCSVCMEAPHNAVLLLCSSYNKGCRPYMCATSYRFSNCLDQYKKAYAKAPGANTPGLNSDWPEEKVESRELLCPLCRGQVKGCAVVKPARKYLNKKKRTCMQEKCSFVGNFKQLKRHVKAEHPCARPREVDPSLEEKWKSLENEREINDVISTLPPGTMVLGDYVIDPGLNYINFDMDMDDLLEDDIELFGTNRLRTSGFQFRRATGRGYESYDDDDDDDEEDDDMGFLRHSAFGRDGSEVVPLSRQHRRMLFFRGSRRRWRHN